MLTMLTVTIKGMLAHKLRFALTALSIALGVAFLAGTLMLTDSMGRAFDDIFGKLSSGTDVAVRGKLAFGGAEAEAKPLPPSVLAAVRSVDGVATAEGQVGGYAVIVDPRGQPIQPATAPTMGGNFITDSDLRGDITLKSGRAPAEPSEVAIDASSAEKRAIPLGSQVRILFRGPAQTFTVVGTVQFAGKDDLGGSTAAYFDTATAMRVLGKTGYDTISVKAAHGVSDEALATRISAQLPAGTEAVTGETMAQESSKAVQSQLGFFNTALLIFAGIALFVGAFIIWNTFSMQVTQRTRELALLRAIGATGRQLMRTVLAEAVAVGLIASAVGLALGFGVAHGLSSLLTLFGLELPAAAPRLQAGTVLAGVLVGTLVTVVAAVTPARRATRVLPVEALRESTPGADRFSRRRLVLASVVAGLGVTALLAGLSGGAPPALIGVGVVLAILGVTGLAPLVARPLASAIGRPLRARGMPGELARQNAMRNPKRTASTAMALMIGVTMVASVSVLAASMKESFHDLLSGSTTANLYLQPANAQGEGFSPEAAKAARGVDGVALVSEVGYGRAKFTGGLTRFTSVDPATVEQVVDLGMKSGHAADLTAAGVLVHQKKADAHHWKVGDLVPAEFAQTGRQDLRIEGIFSKRGFDGDYLISLQGHRKAEPDLLDGVAFVKVAPGADVQSVQSRIDAALAGHPDAHVLDQKQFEKVTGALVEKLVALITVLLMLAVVIALLGIINTLALAVFERTRELGLLRAVGMTRNQVRAMVRWESVVISVFGAGVGTVLGAGLGIALTRALQDQGIESIAVPAGRLSLYVVLAAVAGVLAAIGPARRAAKVDVLRAVVTE